LSTPHVKIGRLWGVLADPPPLTPLERNIGIINKALLQHGLETIPVRKPSTKPVLTRIRNGTNVGIPDELRNTGVYIIGQPGTGKSTLALVMAIQDIRQGKGVAFIDPHDTARQLLDYIPADRINDVIYFEPKEFPRPIDLLETDDQDAMNELASDVIAMFKRLSGDASWGPQMDTVLKFAVHALVRARQRLPVTFMDLANILTFDKFRKDCLDTFQDGPIHHFWEDEYPAIRGKDTSGPVVRRMTDFRLSSVLPNIFGKEGTENFKRTLNLREIMDQRKILIADLGYLLPDDQRVIGTFLITKIKLLLPRRAERIPFYLYVDELDEFAASPYQQIITKCRKFNINLTLMNQGFYQIREELNRKAIKRIDTKVVFRIDDEDARLIAAQIAPFEADHAVNLKTLKYRLYEALYRSPLTGTHLIRTFPLPPPKDSHRDAILDNMRNVRLVHTRDTPAVCSTKKDGNPTPPSDKSDEIHPTGPTNVPFHAGKK
jgi:hypothetical protein